MRKAEQRTCGLLEGGGLPGSQHPQQRRGPHLSAGTLSPKGPAGGAQAGLSAPFPAAIRELAREAAGQLLRRRGRLRGDGGA